MTLVQRGLGAAYAKLRTRSRTDLRDVLDFRVDATSQPRGINLTLSGILIESSKAVAAVKAEQRQDAIELSVIDRGIVAPGKENCGEFRKQVSVPLPQHCSYRLMFVNRDGTEHEVGTVAWRRPRRRHARNRSASHLALPC